MARRGRKPGRKLAAGIKIRVVEVRTGKGRGKAIDPLDGAIAKGIQLGAAWLEAKVKEGFDVGGFHPKTGAPGFWPQRKIPDGLADKYAKHAARMDSNLARGVRRTAFRGPQVNKRQQMLWGKPVMTDTGHYQSAIRAAPTRTRKGGTIVVTARGVGYAKYHEQANNFAGFTITKITAKMAKELRARGFTKAKEGGKVKLPARRVFVMPDPWKQKLAAIIKLGASTALRR